MFKKESSYLMSKFFSIAFVSYILLKESRKTFKWELNYVHKPNNWYFMRGNAFPINVKSSAWVANINNKQRIEFLLLLIHLNPRPSSLVFPLVIIAQFNIPTFPFWLLTFYKYRKQLLYEILTRSSIEFLQNYARIFIPPSFLHWIWLETKRPVGETWVYLFVYEEKDR